MSLDDKTIALAFPFLNENGIEFELDAVNLLRLPSSQSKDVIVERTASVGTDVEKFAMLLYLTDDFLRAGTAVCPEAIYTDVLGFQKSEESLMGVCLMKTHIRVAIAVLDIDYLVTDNIYARPVAEELFVGRFCIILLRFKKLMVKVNIVFLNFLQLACRNQSVYKQCVITSAILQMAIIFYLTEKTGSAMVLSMASLVGFLPYAVFGPAIGVLVDRHDRKKIMIGADLIIAAAGAVLAIVAFYMELPVWMVMIVLFIRSIGTAFHTPALNSVTPLLVPEEQLTKCAGYSQSLQSISYIVSPAVAALLYSVWDLNAIIAIDVLGAVIASITVAIVRIPKLGDRVQSLEPNFIREMKEGMAVLRQNKGLFALLLVGTLYMFVYMPINALYPLITMECFNGTPMHISITEIAYASGMLIGGLLLGLFGNYQKRILLITASIFMMGISLTISGLLPQSGFFIFVVCCAIMGLSVPFYSGVQTALFQEKIKPEYLGRVFSLTGSIMSLAMPIGLILSGFFADRIGVNHWFLLSGVLIIGIAIACPMITEVRKLDLKQNS